MFSDKLINEKISEFHVHSYWSNCLDKKLFVNYLKRKYPEKKIVMSEWCEMVKGRDYSMDSAITLAREIIEDILIGKVIEWHYWIAVSKYDFRDGLIYIDYEKDGNIKNITPTKRLWAMGNFSKFFEPGSKVVEISYKKKGYLDALAFKSPDEDKIIIVVLNSSEYSHELHIDFQDEKFKLSNTFVTDKDHGLEEFKLNSSETITIFPQSVSTLIYKK
jgi:O-glycosyl hydrolase